MDRSKRIFNNAAMAVQSWYVAARSRDLGRGRARSFDLLNRRIVIYRERGGSVHALDAHCPHLGADLGHGRVSDDGIECAFHHWCFGPDGVCRSAPAIQSLPQRRIRAYPLQERWGLIWIFNGPATLFDLPAPPDGQPVRALRLPPQHIQCHPHLVIANGLDASHLDALHGIELTREPRLTTPDAYRVQLEISGRPRSSWMRRITGCRHHDFDAVFTTVGGNLALLAVNAPLQFYVLFSGHGSQRGGCDTRTILFLPRGRARQFFQALACTYMILADDHRVLDDIQFVPGFTEADEGLASFARGVDAMEVW